MRSVSRVTRTAVAISAGVVAWVGCSVKAVSTASEADCARLEDLADGGEAIGELELPEQAMTTALMVLEAVRPT